MLNTNNFHATPKLHKIFKPTSKQIASGKYS